jgi:hypothetical protein
MDTAAHRASARRDRSPSTALLGAILGLLVVGVFVGWRLVIHAALAAAH